MVKNTADKTPDSNSNSKNTSKNPKAVTDLDHNLAKTEPVLNEAAEMTDHQALLGPAEKKASRTQKLKGAFLVFLGIAILAVIALVLWHKLTRPEPLENFLPSKATVALLEIDIDPNSPQVQEFFQVFKKHPVYQKDALIQLLNKVIAPLNFQNFHTWQGRKLGLVFLQDSKDLGHISPVLFLETKDENHSDTMGYLKDLVPDRILVPYTYTDKAEYYYIFIKKYLVIAPSKQSLKILSDAQTQKDKLRDDPHYRKIADNLPQGALVFFYTHLPNFYTNIAENEALHQRNEVFKQFEPFLKIFTAEGVSIFAKDKQLQFQTFSSIDRTKLNGESYLTHSDKYQGKLLELADENPVLLAGGHNLSKELQSIEKLFQTNGKSSEFFFQSSLDAFKNKYFGPGISWQEDIYPLLSGEYLVEMHQNFQTPEFTVFLELSNPALDPHHPEKIIEAFSAQSGIFAPHTQEFILPDGTKGQEIVASTQQVMKTEALYRGMNITSIKLGELPWNFYYTLVDRTFIISTNRENLQKSMDRKAGRLQSRLTTSPVFQKDFRPLLRTADEVFHLKIGALTEFLGLESNPVLKPYVDPFFGFTMTNNFFDDGISTTGRVDVF